MWDNHPVAAAVGLTWWGANAIGSAFGTGDYSNPYYEEGMPATYMEPIVTQTAEAPPEEGALPPGVSPEAVAAFDQAREAFMQGDYAKALKLTDQAVAKMPRDAVLQEFRSLVLFALKRYQESAAVINPVLAVGPGWDYQTLSTLYPDIDTYTAQLRSLEAAVKKSPKAADLRFLLGYHYLTLGYGDDALSQFKRAAELQPKDSVSASLVATLSPRDAEKSKEAGPAPKAVPSDQIVGNWSAAGPRTAKYAMNLKKDGTFSWAYSRGSRKQEVKGVFTVEGNVLAMEPDGGGVMLAELTAKDDALQFKMVGGSDAPLEFRRTSSN
jgi:tetratricopeptide (TPR) repeat protein